MASALVVLALLAGTLPGAAARADQLANQRAEASALATRIAALGQQEDGLSEQYDLGVVKLAQADARVTHAARAFQLAKQEQAKTIALLQQDAIQAYVGGGPQAALGAPTPMTSLDEALLRQDLEDTFAAEQASALDGYQLAEADASTARAALAAARNADARQLARLGEERQQVQAAQAKLQVLEQQVRGRIATLVAEIQQARLLAQQRAEAAQLRRQRAEEAAAAAAAAAARARSEAALEAAAATTTTVAPAAATAPAPPPPAATTTVPPSTVVPATSTAPATQVPGTSPAASVAVQAALSRVGDPYVWGAAGPGAFDCSGLIMWAYAQAGVYLPHFSGAQYTDTTHIPMSDLQPGDLVFPADPGQHVAMYIGGGEVVQAPYTGADVQVIPLNPFFVLASRVG